MIQKLQLAILFIILVSFAYGQNDPMSSLNMFNHMFYNPGYAGDGNEIESRLLVREQWMGYEGNPSTQFFNIDAPFKLFNVRHGAGLAIINDKIGNFSNIGLNISYAYRKNLMQGEVGIGAGLNMLSQSWSGKWNPSEGDASLDPAIPSSQDDKPMVFDMNLGVFYSSDNLYMSISGRNLLNSNVKYNIDKPSFISRQIYFATAYDYQLPNPMYSIQPGAFIATDLAVTQLSVSGILTYNKRFFGGLAYRPIDAITFIGGIDLPSGIEIAVSYDVTTSRIIKYSTGSFEFMLGYCFSLDIDKGSQKYKSVRFL